MDNNRKLEIFETMPVPKAVLSMAVPTVLSSLVMVIYNLADTFFVGMLNDPIQNAAVTLAAPVLLAFNAVNNLFGVGGSSMMSRSLGVKDYDRVRRSSAFAFYAALVSGVLFSLMCTVFQLPLLNLLGADDITRNATSQYMLWTVTCGAVPAILNVVMAYLVRSEGNSLNASVGTMSGCVLNMILDPIFILPSGLNMGVAGAGLATCISNCFACLYFAVYLFYKRGNTYVCVHPRWMTLSGDIVKGVCVVGIPASIQNLLNVTSMTVLNNFTAAFGSDAVAAMGIAQKINMIPMQIAFGLSQGVQPLLGYNYGSKNIKRMKSAVLFTAKIAVGTLTVVAACYFIGAERVINLFIKNDAVVSYGGRFLQAMCFGVPCMCMDFIGVGVFQSCGMGGKALLFAILRKIVLEIPILIIMNAVYPLYGLSYAQLITEAILATVAIIVLIRMFKRLESNGKE